MMRGPVTSAGPILAAVTSAAARVIAWDTETWRIAPGRLAPPLVCHSFAWRGTGGRIESALVDRATGLEVLRQFLAEPEIVLVAHNVAFDLAVAWAAAGDLAAPIWQALDDGRATCTKIRESLLHVASGAANRASPPTSLAACVKRHFGENVEGKAGADAWRLRYHELDGISITDWPEAAQHYAEYDARLCLRVYEAQTMEAIHLIGHPKIPDEAAQTRAAFALHLTAVWGFRTDSKRVASYVGELRTRVDRATEALESAGIVVGGVTKKAPMQAALVAAFNRTGIPLPLTDKGEELLRGGAPLADLVPAYVSTAGEYLRDVSCVGDPCTADETCDEVLHVLADRLDAERELSRYAEHLERGVREVLNPRIDPVKVTGRCSAGNPPYQQFPRRAGARECVVPRPGYVLIGADYKAAELVTLAQVLVESVGSSALAEVLNAGLDPHLRTGADILGIEYDVALERYHAGDRATKDARQLAKALNFGLPGGLGPATFVGYAWGTWGVRVTEERARALKDRWLGLYPEVRDYFAIVSQRCDAGGGSFDLVQPYSGRLRGSCGYCDGCNSSFQGLAADAAKAALYRVAHESWLCARPASALFGARPILFVHDEIIAEARENRAADAAERLAVVMVDELRRRCPDVAPACEAEPWVARRWSKAIKPLRDADGCLVPWDD